MARFLIGNLGLGCLVAAVLASSTSEAGEGAVPTYHKDVARILQKNCQDCHRPEQVAPFALLTYEQARKRAADLVRVTDRADHATVARLAEFRRTVPRRPRAYRRRDRHAPAWADAGCPEGDLKDAPAPPQFSSAWPLGEPDLILPMPEPYTVAASGDDDFRVFVLKTNLPEDRWIRAVDFRPGNRKVVHHVIAGVDTSGRGRELDAADPGPGYYALGGFGNGVEIRAFLPIWTPGADAALLPRGHGIHPAQRRRHPDPGALPQERQARNRRHGDRPLPFKKADAAPGPDRLRLPQRLDHAGDGRPGKDRGREKGGQAPDSARLAPRRAGDSRRAPRTTR